MYPFSDWSNPLRSDPIEVFISYSSQDEELMDELCVHLEPLTREQKINPWQDRAIEAGAEWATEIKNHLESADIILLLITAHFLASDHCFDHEMQQALERHQKNTVRVIPIIMKPCDWQHTDFSKLWVLPRNTKPITTWDNRDEALLNVVQGIRQVVESFVKPDIEAQKIDQEQGGVRIPDLRGGTPVTNDNQPGSWKNPTTDEPLFITGMPIVEPRHFFGRQRILKRLFNLLKTRPLQNAAIIGQRRSGKTSLLNYLRTITTTPPDQLRPGQKSDWLLQAELYRWIYVDFQDARMAHRQELLRYLLESMGLAVPESCDLERFMGQVSDRVQSPTVILMDEVGVSLQRCPELDDGFWESLRSLANQTDGNLAFVLATPEHPMDLARNTGHSSPFFNIFGYTTTLGPFTDTEAQEFIAHANLSLPQEDIAWLVQYSGRWPLLLQILCRERMFRLEEDEMGDDWQEEGLRQIRPFTDLLN